MDLAVRALPLLLEQRDVHLHLLERLLQRLDEDPEPAHRLLRESVCVLAERLGGQCLDRGLDPDVEGATLRRQRALGLGQRELRLAGVGYGAVPVGERPAQRDEIDACSACDEPDQESDDGHEGDIR